MTHPPTAITEVWAIVEMDHGVDGRAVPPTPIVKKIFDYEAEANEAVFKPYRVVKLEINLMAQLAEVERKLTVKQKYALSQFNGQGIKDYLKL